MYLHASAPMVGSQTAQLSGSVVWIHLAVPADHVSALGDVAISMQETRTLP